MSFGPACKSFRWNAVINNDVTWDSLGSKYECSHLQTALIAAADYQLELHPNYPKKRASWAVVDGVTVWLGLASCFKSSGKCVRWMTRTASRIARCCSSGVRTSAFVGRFNITQTTKRNAWDNARWRRDHDENLNKKLSKFGFSWTTNTHADVIFTPGKWWRLSVWTSGPG